MHRGRCTRERDGTRSHHGHTIRHPLGRAAPVFVLTSLVHVVSGFRLRVPLGRTAVALAKVVSRTSETSPCPKSFRSARPRRWRVSGWPSHAIPDGHPDGTWRPCVSSSTCHGPGVKVIVFTAAGDPDVREAFFEAGASAFISKTSLRRPAADHQATVRRSKLTPELTQQHRQPRIGNATWRVSSRCHLFL